MKFSLGLWTAALLLLASTTTTTQAQPTPGGGRLIDIGGDAGVGWTEGVCYPPVTGVTAGDVLTFDFAGHDVYQLLSREDFDTCDFSQGMLVAGVGASPFSYTVTEEDVA